LFHAQLFFEDSIDNDKYMGVLYGLSGTPSTMRQQLGSASNSTE
jgi:hypothetical protein